MPEWSLRTAKICGAEGNSAQLALGWAALATIGCCFVVLYAMTFVIIGGQRIAWDVVAGAICFPYRRAQT